jgi:O-antigen ligase
MSDKLRNPLLAVILSIFVLAAAVGIIVWPLTLSAKLLLSAALLIFIIGFFSYRWGLFLFIFFRPLIDYTANTNVLTVAGLSLNLPTLVGGLLVIFSSVVLITNYTQLREKKITLVWLIFLAWAASSLIFSFDPTATIKELLKFISIFLSFLVAYILVNNNTKLTSFIKAIIFSALLPALVALYQFISGTGLMDSGRNRLLGTLTHPNMLAYYLLVPLTLAIFIFLNIKKERVEAWGYLAITVFLTFVLFFTYTRGAYIALLLILLIIGGLKFRKFLLAALLTLLLIYAYSLPLQARVNSLFNLTSDGSVSWRLEMWGDGLAYFQAKPLAGYGFGLSDEVFSQNSRLAVVSPDPHNDYLRLALGGGLIGVSCYVILIIVLLFCLIKEYRQETRPRLKMLNLFVLAVVLAIFALSFGDNLLNDTALQWDFWMLIGALLATQQFSRIKTDLTIE